MDIMKSEFFWNDLQLLSKTLATIDDDKWVCQLAAEATRYLSTYNNDLEEKVSVFNAFISPTISKTSSYTSTQFAVVQ